MNPMIDEEFKEFCEKNKWKVPRIKPSSKMGRTMQVCWSSLEKRKPVFIIITGKQGRGKSRGIFLNILDYWFKYFHRQLPDKSCFGVSFITYLKALKKAEPMGFAGLDEASDIFDKGNTGQKVLTDLYQTYQIIREKYVFTCVVMPSIFDLYTRFARNSVTFWFHALKRIDNVCRDCGTIFAGNECKKCGSKNYKEGQCIFNCYNQQKLQDILSINEQRTMKRVKCGVQPVSEFPTSLREYKGELTSYYDMLKNEKTKDKVGELLEKYGKGNKKNEERERKFKEILKLKMKGTENKEIAKQLDIHPATVSSYLRKVGDFIDIDV